MKRLILVVLIVGLTYLIWQTFSKKFDRYFIGSSDELRPLKSLKKKIKYSEGDSIYWYTYEYSVIGKSSDLITLASDFTQVTIESAKVRGDYIIDVGVSNDTIVIISSIPIQVLDSSLVIRNIVE